MEAVRVESSQWFSRMGSSFLGSKSSDIAAAAGAISPILDHISNQRGAMRIAPSSRITSPLSIGFEMMWDASAPYSAGSPSRDGCGT